MNTKAILEKLNIMVPEPKFELVVSSPFELIVALILSAQCTDKRVNEVTSVMFKKFNKPEHYASMMQEQLEEMIKPCGFYRNKAKNIISMSRDLISKFNGSIPKTMEELTTLAGVGRKTANVILAEVYNIPAIAVDTHVFKVTNRLGMKTKNVEECEQKLMEAFDKKDWSRLHLQLVLHGRYTCMAPHPHCERCLLTDECEFYITNTLKK